MMTRVGVVFLCFIFIFLLCSNKAAADTEEAPSFTIHIGSKKNGTVSEKISLVPDKKKPLSPTDNTHEDSEIKTDPDKNKSKPAEKTDLSPSTEQKLLTGTDNKDTQVEAKPSTENSNPVNKDSTSAPYKQEKPTLIDSKKEPFPVATPVDSPDKALPEVIDSTQIESPEEKEKNKVSETFAPDNKEKKEPLSGFLNDYSLIFDSRTTKQELAIVPTFYRSRTYGLNWGLRIFTFSPDDSGYYFSTSLVNKFSTLLFKWDFNYRKPSTKNQENLAYGQFSNYFEPYYERKGMKTDYQDEKKLYTYQLNLRYQRIFKEYQPYFYGIEVGSFFRKQRQHHLDEDLHFSTEFLMYLKLTGGYDSREDWKNPDKGSYHQLALSCVPILGQSSSYCLIDADFRSYIPLPIEIPILKQSVLALRVFAGTSLIAPASYSMAYALGGSHILRGFTDRRFHGDKIYFTQSELRLPLWKNIFSGVLFFELGEVAGFEQNFSGFLWDYGIGFRLGIPPSYNIKLRADLGIATEKTGKNSYNFIINFFQAF